MNVVRALLLATVVVLSACSSSSGPQPAELPSIYRPLQVRTGQAFSADGSGRVHSGTHPAARADALKRVPEWFSR